MKRLSIILATSALCLAATAQARMPIFIEYEGVKGESAKVQTGSEPATPQTAPANPNQSTHTKGRARGINTVPPRPKPQASQEQAPGGVRVASGDLDGDGTGHALLLPAVQKVREPAATGEHTPRGLQAPRPAPQPLLVPAVQKPGVGSRRVAPRPQNPPKPTK